MLLSPADRPDREATTGRGFLSSLATALASVNNAAN